MPFITDSKQDTRYPLLAEAARRAGFGDISDLALEITTVRPSKRLGQRIFLLAMSHVTPDAYELYAKGWCALLAQAMHHHKGWPFVVLTNKKKGGSHVGVLTPWGEFLDVIGERPLADEVRPDDKVTICRDQQELTAAGFGPMTGCSDLAEDCAIFLEATLYLAEQLTSKAAARGQERRFA